MPVTATHAALVTSVPPTPLAAAQFPGHSACTLVPYAFDAVTVKRYHTPFVRPVTVPVTVP